MVVTSFVPRGEAPAGDPAFIGEAIGAVMADYTVDRERLYLFGVRLWRHNGVQDWCANRRFGFRDHHCVCV